MTALAVEWIRTAFKSIAGKDDTGEVLKQAFLLKRTHNKKNYKSRWFILTQATLYYCNGTVEKKGKIKGKAELKNIKFIECLKEEAESCKYALQVSTSDTLLYIATPTQEQRDDWISTLRKLCANNSGLHDKFHPGVSLSSQWSCCHNNSSSAPGCQESTWQASNDNVQSEVPIPFPKIICNMPMDPKPITAKKVKTVVALYEFEALEEGDLSLVQGMEYEVVDDAREHWWKVKNNFGVEGYIPSNYVEEKTSQGLNQHDWYAGDMTRQKCEVVLRAENKEGTFVVRNSSTKGMYTLSLLTRIPLPQVKHYHIKTSPKSDFYLSEKHTFISLQELIFYHKHNSGGLATRLKQPPSNLTKPTPLPHGLSHDKWEIDPSELTLLEELGSGQFGVVRKAKWRGTIDVAVKMMKEGTMSEDDFIDEAHVMTKLQHPNLVQLYGVCSKNRPIYIVTEYMKHGALLNYLRAAQLKLVNKPIMLVDICVQVSSGMAYLEQYNYIHRDLAARNCLVKEGNTVKVADFGLARWVIDDEYLSSGGTKFPIKWAPPEVLSYTRFSSKSDVWAYGVLMWEVFSCGKMPYGRATNAQVVEQVQNGQRLERPRNCPREVYTVMRSCWEKEADTRPSFRYLKHQLESILEDKD